MLPERVRVLLVDDEPLVREGVRNVLARQPGIEIVAEARDGLEALDAIERFRPDLLFLDIQMPALDGFGVLQSLEESQRPTVVFVTAYEQYALRAFDAHAVDYLLKPFDDARLLKALERALQWIERGSASDPRVSALLRARKRQRFVVKHGGRFQLVQADDVHWIEARGNYVHLHASGGPFLLRETLTALADTLDPQRFVRVHRSALVDGNRVQSMRRQPSGDYELTLTSGERIPLSRSYRDAFLELWKGQSS